MNGLRDDERFDIIISDPPSFAPSQRAVPGAIRAYRNLHQSCMQHVEDGGLYLAASCSSHISLEVFETSLRDAARTTGRTATILETWGAAPDHPVLRVFPEGQYLKVCLLRIGR
jgi:23S rRNA (cytosine1962-C5)-methyltransferase